MLTVLRMIAAASVVILVLLFLRMILRPLRRFLEDDGPPPPHRAPAHVCGHCARILIAGSMPPIISACGPEVPDCTRQH